MTARPDDRLESALATIAAIGPVEGSRWHHLKSGGSYAVIGCCVREIDLVPLVVYRAEYGDRLTWARPLNEFRERFALIADPKEEHHDH